MFVLGSLYLFPVISSDLSRLFILSSSFKLFSFCQITNKLMFLWVLEPIAIPKYSSHFDHLVFPLLLDVLLILEEEDGLCLGIALQSNG
jgi:hypothetical protein